MVGLLLAGFDRLISQSPRELTMRFYVAVLMTLLIPLHTGLRVSEHAPGQETRASSSHW